MNEAITRELAERSHAAAKEAEAARLAAEAAAIAWYESGNVSQADLARALGVTPPAVLYMLRRRGVPTR